MKFTKSIVLSAFLSLPLMATAAEAISVHEYVALKGDLGQRDNPLIAYLSGAADSLHSANAVLLATNRPQLYCGRSAPVSATEAIQLIDGLLAQQIRQGKPAPRDMAVTTVLANALSLKYPCRK